MYLTRSCSVIQYLCPALGAHKSLAKPASASFLSTMTESLFNEEDSKLVADLYRLSNKSPKLVRFHDYDAPSDPSICITSWKMNEFKYHDVPSPFPTLARGLFTRELPKDGKEHQYQIVARGYDKFFNIGEVPWTDVSTILCSRDTPIIRVLTVVFYASSYWTRLHAVPKVERMHHFHCSPILVQTDRNFETRPGANARRRRNSFPGGSQMAQKTSCCKGQVRRGACRSPLGKEVDRSGRGMLIDRVH